MSSKHFPRDRRSTLASSSCLPRRSRRRAASPAIGCSRSSASGGEAQFRLIVRSADDSGAAATTLVDPAALLEDATAALDWYYPSPDGSKVAFGVSIGGDERSTLRIVDVETATLLADTIPDTRWASLGWTPAGDAFAYTRYPSGAEYGERVWWHMVGDHHGHDELVFGDLPVEESMQSITLSRDGRWLVVHCNVGWSRADVHLIDRATGSRTVLVEGVEAQTFARVVDDRLIGVTTLDAPRGRVFAAPVTAPTHDAWVTLVPESDMVIDAGGVQVAGDRLLVHGTRSALAVLRSYALDGTDERAIELPGPVSLAGFDAEDTAARRVLAARVVRPTGLACTSGPPSGASSAGARPRRPSIPTPFTSSRSATRRPTVSPCRCSSSVVAISHRRPRRRACSRATADSPSRRLRRTRRSPSRSPRRAVCSRTPASAAAPKKARTGTAPACESTSSRSSTTSTRRGIGSSSST